VSRQSGAQVLTAERLERSFVNRVVWSRDINDAKLLNVSCFRKNVAQTGDVTFCHSTIAATIRAVEDVTS